MIVYDNACNLHRYAVRRAAKFFSNSAIRVDRLHVFNHHGYDSDSFSSRGIKYVKTQKGKADLAWLKGWFAY